MDDGDGESIISLLLMSIKDMYYHTLSISINQLLALVVGRWVVAVAVAAAAAVGSQFRLAATQRLAQYVCHTESYIRA